MEAVAEHLEVLRTAERIQIGEDRIALDLARIADLKMARIGVHTLHFCPNLLGGIRKIDAVAQGLAHLGLAVSTRQAQAGCVLRQENLRFDQSRAVGRIELADDFTGLLDHRLLILSNRHAGSLEGSDVGSLADRIAEEAHRSSGLVVRTVIALRKAPHLDFSLDRRISLKPLDRYQIHIEEAEFGKFTDLGLDEDVGLFRIKAG